jgi:hypothetical protein
MRLWKKENCYRLNERFLTIINSMKSIVIGIGVFLPKPTYRTNSRKLLLEHRWVRLHKGTKYDIGLSYIVVIASS